MARRPLGENPEGGRLAVAEHPEPPSVPLALAFPLSAPHAVTEPVDVDRLDDAEDFDQLRRSVDLAKVRRARRRTMHNRFDEPVAAVGLADVVAVIAVSSFTGVRAVSIVVPFVLCLLVVRAVSGVLRARLSLSVVEDLRIDVASCAAVLGIGLVAQMAWDTTSRASTFFEFTVFAFAVSLFVRAVFFAIIRRRRRGDLHRRRTLVIGTGPVGRHVAEGLLGRREFGLEPIGFVDTSADVDVSALPLPLLGASTDALGDLIVSHDVSTIVAAFVADDDALVDVMLTATRLDTEILVVPRLYELASDDPKTDWINGVPLVRHTSGVTNRVSWRVKRFVDLVVASVALVLLSPVLLVVTIAVLIDGGRPVLFRQPRIGIDGLPFELLKFRSMHANAAEAQTTWSIVGDPRISRIGRFIRRSSLDELPQLLNIVRGDMSLVGPRPERPVFVTKLSAEYSSYWARHRLPAGLTGWAQVNGLRGDTSIAQRVRFDNFYIANWSLWLDLRIVLLTVREVFRGSGQ